MLALLIVTFYVAWVLAIWPAWPFLDTWFWLFVGSNVAAAIYQLTRIWLDIRSTQAGAKGGADHE